MTESRDKSDSRFAAAAIRVSSPTAEFDAIASVLPIVPSERVEKSTSPLREARWIYRSEGDDVQLEEHVARLLDLVDRYQLNFEALPKDCVIDIWCTLSTDKEFTGFALSRDVIRRAAVFNIEFIFSVYH